MESKNINPVKVYFFGPGAMGKIAYERWSGYAPNDLQLVGYISTRRGAGETYNGLPIVRPEAVEKDATVVITLGYQQVKEAYAELTRCGIRDIRRFLGLTYAGENVEFLRDECIELHEVDKATLPYVEMHVVDHCNLNCRGCSHFSPTFPKEFPNLNKRLEDVVLLKEKLSGIMMFRVLGGEPFLHPELADFLRKVRGLLPNTDLRIASNGLLVPSISDEILEVIAQNRIIVDITEYRPTRQMIDKITNRLIDKNIRYSLSGYDAKQKFNKPLSVSVDSKYEHFCLSYDCVNIYEGKIAMCARLMFVNQINQKFGTNFPTDGIMSLKDCPSRENLLQALQTDVPLCRHCIKNSIEWESCGKEAVLEDFVVLD